MCVPSPVLPRQGAGAEDLSENLLVLWRATDRDRTCQRLILDNRRPPEHLFPSARLTVARRLLDKMRAGLCIEPLSARRVAQRPAPSGSRGVEGRLPAELREEMAQLRPAADASTETASAAYEGMRQLLWERKSEVFTRKLMAECIAHPGCTCPLAWADPDGRRPSQRPLTCNVSGPQCTPWSSMGARRGLADGNSVSWWIWLAEMSEMRYDLTLVLRAIDRLIG